MSLVVYGYLLLMIRYLLLLSSVLIMHSKTCSKSTCKKVLVTHAFMFGGQLSAIIVSDFCAKVIERDIYTHKLCGAWS